ncbi:MAG: hypothetical protein ABIJ34_04275 [archaeon]
MAAEAFLRRKYNHGLPFNSQEEVDRWMGYLTPEQIEEKKLKEAEARDQHGCLRPIEYLDYFVKCSICDCKVKRYHTTMMIYTGELHCYYCISPEKYKREEHPDECVRPPAIEKGIL